MKRGEPSRGKHTIPAVNRAIELLRLLADEGEDAGETTTKALALRLGVPRTTCYRILRSLAAQDWVRCDDEGRYALSLGLLPVLQPLRHVEQLADRVQPMLEPLALRTGLTAKASVREGDFAVTVARCPSPKATAVAVRLGASFHLAFGSSGAVLLSGTSPKEVRDVTGRAPAECWAYQQPAAVLARLAELRAKGWCADAGTFRPSCHAVSAPLRDGHGNVLAAITVIGFPHELPPEKLPSMAKLLLQAARQAEAALRSLTPAVNDREPAA